MNVQIDKQMDKQTDKWIVVCANRQTKGQTNAQIDRQMD